MGGKGGGVIYIAFAKKEKTKKKKAKKIH